MVWYGWYTTVGYHGMVTRVLGGGAILHLVATHSWVENAALWRQEWEGPYHTIPGGTTQERRGPEGHNFQPRNPPEKESRDRRYRVHAGTVWQVSDVRRLYVRCQIFQWPSPWRRMTGVWPDRRMSDDFTSGSQVVGSDSGISTPDQETLATVLGKVSSDGIWAILVNGIQLVAGDWSSQMEGG